MPMLSHHSGSRQISDVTAADGIKRFEINADAATGID
jgi:hypothetical protein